MSDTAPKSKAVNTAKAYTADWRHYARWCRATGASPLPPSGKTIVAYLSETAPTVSLATIERRLAGLAWNFAQRGFVLDRADGEITASLERIRRNSAGTPQQKAAITQTDLISMVGTLAYDLRGLRDRAILLLGHAGALRRSQIVGLDIGEHTGDGGRLEMTGDGLVLTLTTKTGQTFIDIPRALNNRTCAVHALDHWLRISGINSGAVFRRTSRDGKRVLESRLSDRHVARLIKSTVLNGGIRPDLPEAERLALYSGQSLRAGR